MNTRRTHIVFLNEGTIFKFLWLIISGRKVCPFADNAFHPLSGKIIQWIAKGTGILPNVKKRSEIFPAELNYFLASWLVQFPDLFLKMEPVINALFHIPRQDEDFFGYAQSVRHAISQKVSKVLSQVAMARFLEGRGMAEKYVIHGINRHTPAIYSGYFGAGPDIDIRTTSPIPFVFNAIAVGTVVLRSFAWITRRLSWRVEARERVLLAADFINEVRYQYLVRDAVDDDRQLMFVYRNRNYRKAAESGNYINGINCRLLTDGRLTPLGAVKSLGLVVGHALRLLAKGWRMDPRIFYSVAKLPYWRVVYRAFIQTYPMDNFLGEDDYNCEHAVRTDELRRAGAKSLGLSHGLPAPEILHPLQRYLDYDVYYVFSRFPYDRYHAPVWPRRMTVRAAGSYGMRRDQIEDIDKPRPKDIVFFVSRLPQESEIIEEVYKIARRFPDKKIYVKAKYGPGTDHYQALFEEGNNQPDNIYPVWDSAYELMLKCDYALANGNSTVGAECMEYGCKTFVWDTYPSEGPAFYREYPGVSVKTAEEVIQRIIDLESGGEVYPFQEHRKLMDLEGATFFDVVRGDLGLEPRTKDSRKSAGFAV